MLGWGTIIYDSSGKKLCMGWLAIGNMASDSTRKLFDSEILSEKLANGYPNRFTVSVESLRKFCEDSNRYTGLTKNIFGSHDFSQPFDPQLLLDEIKDMDDTEQIIIEEWDES